MPDNIKFFQNDVPAAFREVQDPKLLAEFKASNDAAIEALSKYQDFMRNDLLPVSNGDFRLGAENFRKKLLYDEMVDIPLDRLLEIGYADLRRNQQQLKEVAAQIDPHRSPAAVLADLRKDHPPADQLLQTFRDTLGGLRQFIEQQKIITIPSTVPPIVEETPPFARALTTASMDTPGAYETKATEAMFNVTLPAPDWKPEKVEQWMQGFNRGTITSTAIHEVYPGHYTQFLWIKAAPTKTRKLLDNNSNAEGWAHYTEQMMLDEGYGGHDPNLRLGTIAGRAAAQRALHCRHRNAHRQDDAGTGAGIFCEGRLSGSAGRRGGSQARHFRSHVSLLQSGQAPDPETARGLPKTAGQQIHAAGIPRPLHAAGFGAHEDHSQEHVGD